MEIQIVKKRVSLSPPSKMWEETLVIARMQLYRVRRIRSNWFIPLVALMGGILGAWWLRDANTIGEGGAITLNTAWGATIVIHILLNLTLVAIPFFIPRLISPDKKERTFEILMSTPVASLAYVVGRYLVLLLVSLSTCLLVIVGMLLTGLFLHFTQADRYDLPNFSTVISVGSLAILSGCFFFISLCYAIYTLLPGLFDYICLPLVGLWIVVGNFNLVPWQLAEWDPTFSTYNLLIFRNYKQNFEQALQTGFAPDKLLHTVASVGPNLEPLLLPFTFYALVGFVLVGLGGLFFGKFLRIDN